QNSQPPKVLRDNVFTSAVAAVSMEYVAGVVRRAGIPPELPDRAICSTIIGAHNHVVEGAVLPQLPAPAADGAQAPPPAPVVPTPVDWANYSRIYIPGHGMPGYGLLHQGEEVFTAQQVAQRLVESGALAHVKDIRITSSGSSETLWRGRLAAQQQPGMQESTLGEAAGSGLPFVSGVEIPLVSLAVSIGRALFGYVQTVAQETLTEMAEGPYRNTNRAFAQEVSRELADLGYVDITVSGYAGEEMPLRDASLTHHERRVNWFSANQPPIFRRRSEVRMEFRGGVVFRQPEGDGNEELPPEPNAQNEVD
ncbi:MAG: hypothetical protein ACRDAP_03220, partial [Shewanella sp.]